MVEQAPRSWDGQTSMVTMLELLKGQQKAMLPFQQRRTEQCLGQHRHRNFRTDFTEARSEGGRETLLGGFCADSNPTMMAKVCLDDAASGLING